MRSVGITLLILILLVSTYSAACPSYKYWDTGSSSCLACGYSCLTCTSSTDCTSCDTANDFRTLYNGKACLCQAGYYDDKVSTVCKTCTSRIANCADCFYNSTYSAGDAAVGALQYGCFSCRGGFILQSNACAAYVTCPAGRGANSVTNVCEACPTGCSICTLSNACTTCNTAANYFLNSTTSTCLLCSLFGCTSCQSLTVCQTCSAGLNLVNGACKCPDGEYYDPYAVTCKSCSKYCLTCSGPSSYECNSCNATQNRLLIGQDCQCDSFNYQESASGPQCSKIDSTSCERGYVKVQTLNQCVEICGDGWRINYECDDGGVVNTDGCSDACKIEPGFSCLNQGTATSICRLKIEVQYNSIKITKDKTQNLLQFEIDLNPHSVVFYNYNMAQILHFRGGFLSVKQAEYKNGILYITTNYSKNLQSRDVQLEIKQDYLYDQNYPENYETLYNTTKATFTLSSQLIHLTMDNNLKPNYYDDQVYGQASRTSKASTAIMIIIYIVLLGALIIKNSLSVVVNINALQICYISLVTIDGMNPVTASLLGLRPVMGYSNLDMFTLNGDGSSIRVKSIGYVQDFANNFNIMFFIQAAFLVASVLASLAAHKKPMIKLASNFLQREALLVIIFNLPTVFFTITLMVKPVVLNIAFSAAAGALIIYQVVHLLMKGKEYFGFKQVFDFSDKGHFKKFIVVYFLARLGTCLSFSFINVEPLKSLIAGASFEGAFILFISFARPFYHSFNNIFMIIAEILAIAFFGSVYASEAVDTFSQVERDKSVDVMIYIVGGIMIIAVANLLYSLIIDIKEGGKKLKAFNELVEAKNKSDEPL